MPLRLLRSFDNFFPANILLTRLQSDGVACYLMDEHTVTIDPLLSNAIGGIKLMVPEEHWEAARNLLRQYDTRTAPVSPGCSACGGALAPVSESGSEGLLEAAATLLTLPVQTAETAVFVCTQCGKRTGTSTSSETTT